MSRRTVRSDSGGSPQSAPGGERDPIWWQLPLVLLTSLGFELIFLRHGLNPVDEGWPLYAAMQLQAGGLLYQDIFFVFPPGHLLAAWIGQALDPPGVVIARAIYAAFNVALTGTLYLLGRRIMPARFAWLAASMVALAAADSHLKHLLFGYRYLVFSILALLCFSERLRTGTHRWMLAAGLCAGVAFCFRLTPAASVCCGLGIAIFSADRSVRSWLRDSGWFAVGLLAILAPVLLWFESSVGLERFWHEVVVRPVTMTRLQIKPVADLGLPSEWSRNTGFVFFVALLFRLCALTYLGYALVLTGSWIRARMRREPFEHTLLLACVLTGGIFFLRSLGRSDEPHLASTLPPFCLLFGHLTSLAWQGLSSRWGLARGHPALGWLLCLGVLGTWIFASRADLALQPAFVGRQPIRSLGGAVATRPGHWWVDARVENIQSWTGAGDRILIMDAISLLHVLSGRPGPGGSDVLMPGTFLDPEEELAFLARLRADPPALVVWPQWPFDLREERSIERTAPRITRWVEAHYQRRGDYRRFGLLVPRTEGQRAPGGSSDPGSTERGAAPMIR